MTTVFGQQYAATYDTLYRSKDYAGEIALIERLLARHGGSTGRRVLDLGCGTGTHACLLAERGYDVTGIDRAGAMIALARSKAAEHTFQSGQVAFHEGDIGTLNLGREFDTALMMFAVLGYQYDNASLLAALRNVRRHLNHGGLFVFDVWNGLAVLTDPPGNRVVRVAEGDAEIVRKTRAILDTQQHLCRVHFDLVRTRPHAPAETWQEEHVMRYFFPQELALALSVCGLNLEDLRAFPDGESPPDENAWNVIGMARAV